VRENIHRAQLWVPASDAGLSVLPFIHRDTRSRKEGQRFTAYRYMLSRHVRPMLVKQDVLNFLLETNIRQWCDF
jgi:hypothetical protein